MNKKSLLIKIVKFIHEANIKYKRANIGDVWILWLIIFMSAFGRIAMLLTIIIILCLRGIYIIDILKRLEAINDEENNKTNDEETAKNI